MLFSTSEPPRPCDPLNLAIQVTPCRKKRGNALTDEEESSSSSEEGEIVASEGDDPGDALKLRGGVVRRRKKSPVKRGLDDLAKVWDVDLGRKKGGDDDEPARRQGGTSDEASSPLGAKEMSQSPNTKDGHPPERFDKILYSDLSDESEWTRLGKGSFGSVYKGQYLGIDVAIKEVMSSNEYDVDKYLYREISLMQQARHPNIILYLGLCLAPPPPRDAITDDGSSRSTRILIISEYLPRGNLRQYILDRTLPFPWRLRMSFSIDIARALSYLHASPRNCMHRDLKGENLLVTENERLKVCDFGLARVVDEQTASVEMQKQKPMTYCGTDGYMSPEILLGEPFTLSTDVFSLGVLFIEIASRTLTSQHHFVRSPPDYGLDIAEVHASLSPNCPKTFIDLALRCCDTYPERRPIMKDILAELREIERQVLAREDGGEGDAHTRGAAIISASLKGNVGSISYAGTTKRGSRPGLGGGAGGGRARPSAPRLPSFEGKVKISSSFMGGPTSDISGRKMGHPTTRESSESDDDGEALLALAEADVPIDEIEGPSSHYATSVLKPHSNIIAEADGATGQRPYGLLGSTSGSTLPGGVSTQNRSSSLPSLPPSWVAAHTPRKPSSQAHLLDLGSDEDEGTPTIIAPSSLGDSPLKLSYLTARTSSLSIANAVVGHKSDSSEALDADEEADEARDVFHSSFQHPQTAIEAPHRFSLIKPGLHRFLGSLSPYSYSAPSLGLGSGGVSASTASAAKEDKRTSLEIATGKVENTPPQTSGVVTGKCNLCTKKFGMMKAFLACDDCGYACHVKCSDTVAPTCPASQTQPASKANSPLTSPTFAPSRPSPPLSRTSSKERSSSKLVKKGKNEGGKLSSK